MDHLTGKNPYERFMIMILDKMQSFEEKLKLVQCKTDTILNILSVGFEALEENKLETVFRIFSVVLDCDIMFVSDNIVHLYISSHKYLMHIDYLCQELLNQCGLRVTKMSIDAKLPDNLKFLVRNKVVHKL